MSLHTEEGDLKIRWTAGAPELCEAIETRLAEALQSGQAPLHHSPQRTLHRLTLKPAEADRAARAVIVKLHNRRSGHRRLRDLFKRSIGRTAAEHEWDALAESQRRGLPVPSPRARGRMADGTELVAMESVPGDTLDLALDQREGEERLAILARLADTIRTLHRHGLRHGDLHCGNVLVSTDRLVLLDLQRLRPFRDDDEWLDDWARLCFSIERHARWPEASSTLRELAEIGPELDATLCRFLSDHQRGRRRRFHRVGRGWSRRRLGRGLRAILADEDDRPDENESLSGLERSRRVPKLTQDSAESFRGLLDPPAKTISRREGRVRLWTGELGAQQVVCKHARAGGVQRALADALRGSEAFRAFRAGRADALISDRAARPLACIERRVLGIPLESWLIMESVGEDDLDTFAPRSPAEAERLWLGLADWLAEQHARGLHHRDLKAGNIRLGLEGDRPTFRLVDLTDLEGPTPLDEATRVRALAQVNASIAEELAAAELRRTALERYARRLPFTRPLDDVASDIARESLARAHRWQARDCPNRAGG